MQADFSYGPADAVNDPAGLPLTVSIFADRVHLRDQIAEDAASAGLRIGQTDAVSALLTGYPKALGDLVLLDCPDADGQTLAALSHLDMRVAKSDARLVVSTTLASLDALFGCLAQSNAQILVDPGRGERVIALGSMLTGLPNTRLRDLAEEDRLTLMRLTEQVGQIAERLDRFDQRGLSATGGAFRFESPNKDYKGAKDQSSDLVRSQKPPLPEPRLVRQIISQRRLRGEFFAVDLFADPAWDMLLDLTAARVEHVRVSVSSLCIAAAVPPTTALRWINQMVESGLFDRVEDDADRRRVFIGLSDSAAYAMAGYFAALENKRAAA
nr:MarR family transcriptional regulator [Parerythrobacter lutipelagi]